SYSLTVILFVYCSQLASSQSQLPRYRAGVVLVPIDLRVVDSHGNPVTDLDATDFEVFEDGVRQTIVQFATRSSTESSQEPRTFCFFLGRGHLNAAIKALDATISFVRSGLLPTDRVCVIAYRRATDITTNHEAIANLLERYRASHDA